MLAKNTPLKVLEKHRNIISIEAILFGQAGFLNEKKEDEYYLKLKKEYDFFKNKFQLTPLNNSVWKFLRLRPYNFPTIRIAQIAQLITSNPRMFNQFLNAKKLKEIQDILSVSANSYWDNHFNFESTSKQKIPKKLGTQTINNLIINVVIPVMFVYGKTINNEDVIVKSLHWLEELKPENNSIIRNWITLKITANSALQSQALIELKNNYCSEKKCLNCSIGNKLLKK